MLSALSNPVLTFRKDDKLYLLDGGYFTPNSIWFWVVHSMLVQFFKPRRNFLSHALHLKQKINLTRKHKIVTMLNTSRRNLEWCTSIYSNDLELLSMFHPIKPISGTSLVNNNSLQFYVCVSLKVVNHEQLILTSHMKQRRINVINTFGGKRLSLVMAKKKCCTITHDYEEEILSRRDDFARRKAFFCDRIGRCSKPPLLFRSQTWNWMRFGLHSL